METIDPNQAARVWQRVRGNSPETDVEKLEQIILLEWEDAAIYLQLSRRCTGRESAALYKLFQQEYSHCACLKGIYSLITGQRPKLPAVQPDREPLELALRNCYGREMQRLRTYEERCADPNYGHVFSRIRDQEQEHCRTVLELIGGLGKKQGAN